ncbi:hypothetical protein EXS61_02040 [Candidatus Parcubacteria bacterium]|nr:hypothetical protein [Candidatus Parcubacteria bacterium]
MTLSNKHTSLLAIFILLLALGGYYFLFSVIKSKNENAFLLSQEIDTYAQSESTRTQSDRVVEEQKDKIAEIGLYFLHKNEVVPFIETVENSGRKTGVEVTIVTVDVGVGEGENAMLTMRFEARGSWNNVNRFISYIENLPYKVSLSKVDVTRASSVSQFFASAGTGAGASVGAGGSAGDVGKKTATAVVAPVWNVTIEMSVLTLQ